MVEEKDYATQIADVFDRSSKAGRLLYKLYGGDNGGKRVGNNFSAQNMATMRTRETAAAPQPVVRPPSPPHWTANGHPAAWTHRTPSARAMRTPAWQPRLLVKRLSLE